MTIKNLRFYANLFTRLKRDNKNGGAPHKPILLLSLIDLFDSDVFNSPDIFIQPEFVATFKTYWNSLVVSNHNPLFTLPFYHMSSEPFWKLIPTIGCEKWVASKSSMRSFNSLKTAVKKALIDQELSDLLQVPENRLILKNVLLDNYFPDNKSNLTHINNDLFSSNKIIEEDPDDYKRKVLELKKSIDDNSFQEEVFIRSGIFKREVAKIYNNTCSISGMRIDATKQASLIDACHILPFAESYDDTLSNGIALCPNLHRAFDRGLISVSDDYTVLINTNFVENLDSSLNISQFKNKKLDLPQHSNNYPSLKNFSLHRKKYNF